MANSKHVAIVRQGARAVARWRTDHPRVVLDLRVADLSEANLLRTNLLRADLSLADLSGADVSGANLIGARLSQANVSGAALSGADLSLANVRGANLNGADLSGAVLVGAFLFGANLSGARLSGADLSGADLTGANLTGADLTGADLALAKLFAAKLSGAELARARCKATFLGGELDLSQVVGLTAAVHAGPSSVGTDTLAASFRGAGNRLTPELTAFFRGAGVPKELLDALPRILAEVKYDTCFISYGQPDVDFATKLNEDLRARGVTCWRFELDKTPGERTWREIAEKRRGADKMVVLCSLKALIRDGVKKEIEEQIDEDPDKIIPISLDDEWRRPGFEVRRGQGRDLRPFLLDRNYADFADPARYDEQLAVLLDKALRRRDAPIA